MTTIGLLLLAMDQTGRYDAWAYAWALIPAGRGRRHSCCTASEPAIGSVGQRRPSAWAASRSVLLVVGAWFFETLFRTGEPPVDLGDGWPILLVAIGAIVVLLGLFGGSEGGRGARPASS